MAAMDEFRAEREAIKTAPFKKKVQYFLDYYKWPTLGVILALAFGISYIVHIVTAPEILMNGIMLNTYSEEDFITDLTTGFTHAYGYDSSDYEVSINSAVTYITGEASGYSNSESIQLIHTQAGAGVLDVMVGDLASMTELSDSGFYADLTDFLTDEQIEKYKSNFIYIDQAVLDEIQASYDNMEEPADLKVTASTNPEDFEKPVPVFINMTDSEKIMAAYDFEIDAIVLGVVLSCEDIEVTRNYIDYLMDE